MNLAQAKRYAAQIAADLNASRNPKPISLARIASLGAYMAAPDPNTGITDPVTAAALQNGLVIAHFTLLISQLAAASPGSQAFANWLLAIDPVGTTLPAALQLGADRAATSKGVAISAAQQADITATAAVAV